MYVTCQPMTISITFSATRERIISSSAPRVSGHSDNASEIEALRKIRNEGKITARVIDKILDANARALYAI